MLTETLSQLSLFALPRLVTEIKEPCATLR